MRSRINFSWCYDIRRWASPSQAVLEPLRNFCVKDPVISGETIRGELVYFNHPDLKVVANTMKAKTVPLTDTDIKGAFAFAMDDGTVRLVS